MFKVLVIAAALAATGSAQAQASAPASKKELVARVLQLQQAGVEGMARQLAEQPAMQLLQRAGPMLQKLPAERRDAVARDIEADVRKYVDDATPIVREQAVKLAPITIGSMLEERFSEDELRQVIALLESPVNRKLQQIGPEMQRALAEKVVTETRPIVEAKVKALEQSVSKRLGVEAAPAAGAAAPKSGASAPKSGAPAPKK